MGELGDTWEDALDSFVDEFSDLGVWDTDFLISFITLAVVFGILTWVLIKFLSW